MTHITIKGDNRMTHTKDEVLKQIEVIQRCVDEDYDDASSPPQDEHMSTNVWPFPPATGAVPWTKQQEKAYQQQKQEQLPAAPF
jgi:hypothetical protein